VKRILFVEDTAHDMELILRSLKKDGLSTESFRVDSLGKLKSALSEQWDIILSDYNLPGFTAVQVLQTIKDANLHTPVIVLSSAISDETAVELMRSGARDFVRKENLSRLAPAILREIESSKGRRRQAEKLLASEKQFQTLADSIPQLAWMAEPDGHIFWYNNKWYEYTGTTFEQMQGWGWERVHNPELLPKMLPRWKASLETGEPWEDTFQLKAKSGEYRWFLSRALPLRDNEGRISGWFGTNTDINEQQRVEAELKNAKATAEEASTAKTRFLANMSHEIRTPLGVMLGFAELALEHGRWSQELEHYLATIKRNGEMLTRVVGEVLDLSKIEASKIEIENLRVELPSLLEEILSFLELQASEKGLKLILQLSDSFPKFAKTDPTRLRQILINLVGNAVKFTERGEVRIVAETVPFEGAGNSCLLKFTVADSGIGISNSHLEKLFEPFTQADSSMTRKYGGTGLGLVLARELARALNGDLRIVNSELGVGTTLEFTILVSNVEEAISNDVVSKKLELNRDRIPVPDLAGVSVLLVEDSLDNQVLFSRYLKQAGASIEFATDGKSGVEKALTKSFDVVLMDIQMPVMNGHEATTQLRKTGFTKPIIALTAHAMKAERDRAIEEGFSDYLTKPLNRKLLIETIKQVLRA
jgi:PAS domain S-box-containing protein